MATKEEIKQELKDAKAEYGKVVEKLNDWEEKWSGRLDDLKRKKVKEDYEGEMDELKEKEKSLEAEKKRWGDQVEEWGKALRGFGGGEGNEQIALKKNYFSFIPFRLFICLFE